MSFQTAPFPTQDAIVNQRRGFIATQVLIDWTTALAEDVNSAPARLRTESVVEQTALIGPTVIPVGSLAAGLYRVSWYARITRAATVSSSLTVTIGFTESGIALTQSGPALTGNTAGTVQSGTVVVRIDAGAPITFSTAYATNGATTMEYRLDVIVEQLDA